jgi:hypothetical protein
MLTISVDVVALLEYHRQTHRVFGQLLAQPTGSPAFPSGGGPGGGRKGMMGLQGRVPPLFGEDENVGYYELPRRRIYVNLQISDPSSPTV